MKVELVTGKGGSSAAERLMPLDYIDDWEMRLARIDAFWQCEIIDRPVVLMQIPKPNPEYPWPPQKAWKNVRERWMDAEYAAACASTAVMNTDYLGDSLPCAYPNLGPEIFSAFFGCELEYGETTSWSIPNLEDWKQADKIRFSKDNPYWHKILEMTDALLEAGKGKFYTGITDLHPGGDAIVAFRDPLKMNIDMVEAADDVKSLLHYVTDVYLKVYDTYHDKIAAAGQAISSWCGIVSTKKWYVPSNDFSCMVSKAMYDEVFLPEIIRECNHMEASVYHLDGPGALRHLDSLLDIPTLNAIQWVYGEGHGCASDWMHVYKKCQAAGKGLQIGIGLDELELFMRELKPNGVYLGVGGIPDRETADAVLKRVENWR